MDCTNLHEKFKRYKGQPVEAITRSGMKYCGILVENCDEESVEIIDCKGRTVHIEVRHIEAIIEPRMNLHRLCGDNDCCCEEDGKDRECRDHQDDCECSSICND